MKRIVRITRMLFDIAVELKDVQSDPSHFMESCKFVGSWYPFLWDFRWWHLLWIP